MTSRSLLYFRKKKLISRTKAVMPFGITRVEVDGVDITGQCMFIVGSSCIKTDGAPRFIDMSSVSIDIWEQSDADERSVATEAK